LVGIAGCLQRTFHSFVASERQRGRRAEAQDRGERGKRATRFVDLRRLFTNEIEKKAEAGRNVPS
jgi:hypothetical protein